MAIGVAGWWATKDVTDIVGSTEEEGHTLKRSVGPLGLTALGVGAIIGTGIFVVIGEGAAKAGPAVVVSFVLAAVTCLFSALSYAELASSVPVSGSAYTYAYATLGELVAFIIGWDLILEYGVSVAAVAVGWGANFNAFLDAAFGFELPKQIALAPEDGGVFNLPAVIIVLAVTLLLVRGTRESATVNLVMVGVKLLILIFFIIAAFTSFNSGNIHPFNPNGLNDGIVPAAGPDLLRLHRLRRGLDRERGVQEPGTRPADRDRRLAGDLHRVLHPGRDRRDRPRCRPSSSARATPRWPPRCRTAPASTGRRPCSPSAPWSRSPP